MSSPAESISGDIERVTFHNPDNGFAVLKVRVKGERDLVTVLGHATSLSPGEHLNANGRWTVDREHGRQFKADDLRTSTPETLEGMQRYLGSGAIRCIGPKIAERIVETYKERTFSILDDYPEVLVHVRGIGAKALEKIKSSWKEQRGVRDIMLFLHSHGIGTGRAIRIYREYGDDAIELIQENPFRLAEEIRGIGFRTADELADRLGVERSSPYRARAGICHVLQQLTTEGHVGYPADEVVKKAVELLGVSESIVRDAIEFQIESEYLIRENNFGRLWLFLTPLFQAEKSLAKSLKGLLNTKGHPLPEIDVEVALDWVESKLDIQLADGQRCAIREACSQRITVITGGPGVGKTTLVQSLLEIFEAKNLQCVLAAPTGRAARRMSEATGRPASTIHRLLEYAPGGRFGRTSKNRLKGDVFVLDEVSMVDVTLASGFMNAVPEHAAVVLVGDRDQLPSVGPGSVLGDMIRSEVVPVVALNEVFRQSQDSRIIQAARSVNAGEVPEIDLPSNGDLIDFYFVEQKEPDDCQDMIVRLVRDRIPERFGMSAVDDVQVLCPMNRSALGTRELNKVLQQSLNPNAARQPEVERFGTTFRPGDRVLQTSNNYDRNVFNGDQGRITKIDPVDQELVVDFEGREAVYDFGSLDELTLAYALTIHKSQGSEYPCVVIPLHTQHFMMLQRNLLYTAITRGKKLVIVVGSGKALEMTVKRRDTSIRYSALARRLKQGG